MNSVPQLAQRQRPDYEAANRFLINARREMANQSHFHQSDSDSDLILMSPNEVKMNYISCSENGNE